MATVNKTVRDTAASMTRSPAPQKGRADRISIQKAKGGYISETEYKGLNSGERYYPPDKAVHKNLSSVKQHMAHAFNDADADEA